MPVTIGPAGSRLLQPRRPEHRRSGLLVDAQAAFDRFARVPEA
ncbi:hypothetical protein [Streptomyces sp.]|nr:hypothetical protein [Streptomyces sp.]HLL32916.1 hypothetical protein [Streptomyces sp.]HZF87539.1 hypothetical protein [Streptomyces sp.]